MKDLLERELNGELTPSEELELNRSTDEETIRRRRVWRDVADTLSESEPTLPASQARIARGVRQRLAVKDTLEPSRSTGLLPWGLAAAGALLVALVATWTEPPSNGLESVAPGPVHISSPVAAGVTAVDLTGPVEIQVAEVPAEETRELIEVVF